MTADTAGAIPTDVNGLVARMLADDEDARYEAALALARLGRPGVQIALSLLSSAEIRARYMACYMLGQISDPDQDKYVKLTDGIPALLHVLETDPDDTVRASAACALGHLDAVEATPLLCLLAVSDSVEARFDAAWALGSFYWDRSLQFKAMAESALLALTHDSDEEVRDWAVFGLHQGDHDTPQVRTRFWAALDDPYPEVRGEAASGLAKFGDRTFIPRLIHLLENDILMSLYFEAAQVLGDSTLLPAVLAAEQRWRDDLEDGEEMDSTVISAVTAFTALA